MEVVRPNQSRFYSRPLNADKVRASLLRGYGAFQEALASHFLPAVIGIISSEAIALKQQLGFGLGTAAAFPIAAATLYGLVKSLPSLTQEAYEHEARGENSRLLTAD